MASFPTVRTAEYRQRVRLGQKELRPGVINARAMSRAIVVNNTPTRVQLETPPLVVVSSRLTPNDFTEKQIGIVGYTCLFYREDLGELLPMYQVFPPQMIPKLDGFTEASTDDSVLLKSAYVSHIGVSGPGEVLPTCTVVVQCRYILGGGGEATLVSRAQTGAFSTTF